MLNLKKDEKILKECRLDRCPIYSSILVLSNNSNLNGIIRCPEVLCQRLLKWYFVCKKCNSQVSLFEGYFNEKNEFECYECPKKQKLEIENKSKIEPNDKFKEIEELLISLSKNQKFMNNYLDSKNEDEYIFYNPMNSSPSPLIWPKKYFNEKNIETLKEEILKFFATYLDRFKDANCEGCKLQDTFYQHMDCLDCSRNKNSPSVIQRDRFKRGGDK